MTNTNLMEIANNNISHMKWDSTRSDYEALEAAFAAAHGAVVQAEEAYYREYARLDDLGLSAEEVRKSLEPWVRRLREVREEASPLSNIVSAAREIAWAKWGGDISSAAYHAGG